MRRALSAVVCSFGLFLFAPACLAGWTLYDDFEGVGSTPSSVLWDDVSQGVSVEDGKLKIVLQAADGDFSPGVRKDGAPDIYGLKFDFMVESWSRALESNPLPFFRIAHPMGAYPHDVMDQVGTSLQSAGCVGDASRHSFSAVYSIADASWSVSHNLAVSSFDFMDDAYVEQWRTMGMVVTEKGIYGFLDGQEMKVYFDRDVPRIFWPWTIKINPGGAVSEGTGNAMTVYVDNVFLYTASEAPGFLSSNATSGSTRTVVIPLF